MKTTDVSRDSDGGHAVIVIFNCEEVAYSYCVIGKNKMVQILSNHSTEFEVIGSRPGFDAEVMISHFIETYEKYKCLNNKIKLLDGYIVKYV